MKHITDFLKNNQSVTVRIRPDYRAKDGIVTGVVRRGYSYISGEYWFYIVPYNDSHPGSSVTKQEVIEIITLKTSF